MRNRVTWTVRELDPPRLLAITGDGVGGTKYALEDVGQADEVAVAAVGREDQGTHTVRLRVVRVCARFQQHPGGLDVADSRGKQQRRGPAARHRVVELFASGALRLLVPRRSAGRSTIAHAGRHRPR